MVNPGPDFFPNQPVTSVTERLQVRAWKPRGDCPRKLILLILSVTLACSYPINVVSAGPLRAGVAKVDITESSTTPANDPLFVKALVIGDGTTTLAIVTVDVVAIGEIGYIYDAPTAAQLENVGGAQEDSDCLLAPEWQKIYEDKVAEILSRL